MRILLLTTLLTLPSFILAGYVITTTPSLYESNFSFNSYNYEFYSRNNKGTWITARNGYVPKHAVTKGYIKGKPIFYCRSTRHNYGLLIPGQGCFVLINGNLIHLTNYDVFVSY